MIFFIFTLLLNFIVILAILIANFFYHLLLIEASPSILFECFDSINSTSVLNMDNQNNSLIPYNSGSDMDTTSNFNSSEEEDSDVELALLMDSTYLETPHLSKKLEYRNFFDQEVIPVDLIPD